MPFNKFTNFVYGRVQLPVIECLEDQYNVNYVDKH